MLIMLIFKTLHERGIGKHERSIVNFSDVLSNQFSQVLGVRNCRLIFFRIHLKSFLRDLGVSDFRFYVKAVLANLMCSKSGIVNFSDFPWNQFSHIWGIRKCQLDFLRIYVKTALANLTSGIVNFSDFLVLLHKNGVLEYLLVLRYAELLFYHYFFFQFFFF